MLTRRELFFDSLRLIVVFPLAAACTSDTASSCPHANEVTTTAMTMTVTSSCNGGHTHDFDVMTADLSSPPAAGVMGESTADPKDGHTHTVALSMAELQQIQAGSAVTKTSGVTLSHTHTFTFHT